MAAAHGKRERRAYIGSFTTEGGPGVLVAAVDADSGALTLVGGAAADVPDPSYLALSADGETLYAVSENADGAVAAYRVTDDKPALTGPPVQVGAGPTHLCVLDGHVLTADHAAGSVTAVPLLPDGTLAPTASGTLRHSASGPHPVHEGRPHAHQVVPTPAGDRFLSVDLGTDTVRVCALEEGVPVVRSETRLRPGSGPRHLALAPTGGADPSSPAAPDGVYVYVLNELAPTVTVCRWNAPDGPLEPLGEVPVLPAAPDGDAYPSGIVVSPDGRHVWTATRGTDVLSVLAVEGPSLRLVTTVPCGGRWPRALAYAAGTLYVANQHSGDVTWFTVDPDTGVPVLAGSVEVPAASCVALDT